MPPAILPELDDIDPGTVLKLLSLTFLASDTCFGIKASFVFALWAWTAPLRPPTHARRLRQSIAFLHCAPASSSTSDARTDLSVVAEQCLLLREFTATGEPILASPRKVEFTCGGDWVLQAPPGTMDHGACNVIYLDRRAQAKTMRRDSVFPESRTSNASMPSPPGAQNNEYFDSKSKLPEELQNNVQSILCTFNEGMLCRVLCAC